MTIVHLTMPSPIGELLLVAEGAALTHIHFEGAGSARLADSGSRRVAADAARVLAETRAQLEAYFAGRLERFDLPLGARGTPFQTRVWSALRDIPFGETISYAELARRIGEPAAVRAVGHANGRNPIPLVVPCHRVIGADGSLTGFSGGIERKRWLLELEGAPCHADATRPVRAEPARAS
jgi:methylated-DNA-[protein]-cysteine S-methyltransferase